MNPHSTLSALLKKCRPSTFLALFALSIFAGISLPNYASAQNCEVTEVNIKNSRSIRNLDLELPYGQFPYGWNQEESPKSVLVEVKTKDCTEEDETKIILLNKNKSLAPEQQTQILSEENATLPDHNLKITSSSLVQKFIVGEYQCKDYDPQRITDLTVSGLDWIHLNDVKSFLKKINSNEVAITAIIKKHINGTGYGDTQDYVDSIKWDGTDEELIKHYNGSIPHVASGSVVNPFANSDKKSYLTHGYFNYFHGKTKGNSVSSKDEVTRSQMEKVIIDMLRENIISKVDFPSFSECNFTFAAKVDGGFFVQSKQYVKYACFDDSSATGNHCESDYKWKVSGGSVANGIPIDVNSPCYDKLTGQMDPDCYELLAPIAGLADETTIDANGRVRGTINLNGKAGGIGNYVNSMLTIVIGLMGIAAVVMIAYAGFEYMTVETFSKKDSAKGRIKNTLIALVLILSIWTILNTINPNLLKLQPEIAVQKLEGGGNATANSNGTYSISRGGSSNTVFKVNGKEMKKGDPWGSGDAAVSQHGLADIRDYATQLGFRINKSECNLVGDSNCTSTYFEPAIAEKLEEYLLELSNDCPDCKGDTANSYIITGGSEAWLHKTHGPDRAILDITSKDTGVNTFLGGSVDFKPTECENEVPTKGKDYIYRVKAENSAACSWKPADHWHVIFK